MLKKRAQTCEICQGQSRNITSCDFKFFDRESWRFDHSLMKDSTTK